MACAALLAASALLVDARAALIVANTLLEDATSMDMATLFQSDMELSTGQEEYVSLLQVSHGRPLPTGALAALSKQRHGLFEAADVDDVVLGDRLNSERRVLSKQTERHLELSPVDAFHLWDMFGPAALPDSFGNDRLRAEPGRSSADLFQGRLPKSASSQPVLHHSEGVAEKSLCIKDVLLPELFVLGAPKCGTSSIADDLRNSGVASNSEPRKEAHMFDRRWLWDGTFDQDAPEKRAQFWWNASSANKCGSPVPKRVIADYTPDYFRLVPPPTDWSVAQWPNSWADRINYTGAASAVNLPLVLKQQVYPTVSSALQFAVMLREPLSRYQSSWYFFQRFFLHRSSRDIVQGGSFGAEVARAVDLVCNSSTYTFRLWGSLYGRHLQGWLNYFKARQFYVIPFLYYMRAGGKASVFADLSKRLGIELEVQPDDSSAVANRGEHPGLDEDVSPGLQQKFQKIIAPENELLVQLLASASTSGLGLARYEGVAGEEDDVKVWLHAGW